MSKRNPQFFLTVIALAGSAFIMLLLLVGYPFLFASIEWARPVHFEERTSEALERGQFRQAVNISRNASRVFPDDPAALAFYGKSLLASGRTRDGVEQLNTAVSLSAETSPYRVTRKPFYCAPARLALGRHFFGEAYLGKAVVHFELARGFADIGDDKYAEYHETLYQAYSRSRLWGRSLEFGTPDDGELDALDVAELEVVARVAEGKRDWGLAERVAARLKGAGSVEGHYLLGRVLIAREQYAAAVGRLEDASDAGRAHSSFFLGLALDRLEESERAVAAYAGTPAGDLYEPFAMAAALGLLARLDAGGDGAAMADAFLSRLDSSVAGLREFNPAVTDRRHLTPLSFDVSWLYFGSGGRFPLSILWHDKRAPVAAGARLPELSFSDEAMFLSMGDGSVLQMQWVENKVNWAGVVLSCAAGGDFPGWVDSARDWFGLREANAAALNRESPGVSLDINRMTWFYSVPSSLRPGGALLAAAKVRDPHGKAGLRWQALDYEDNVVAENSFGPHANGHWAQCAAYFRPPASSCRIRLQLETISLAGTVSFDDVMLVEVEEPGGGG